jgi:hypothetical protein
MTTSEIIRSARTGRALTRRLWDGSDITLVKWSNKPTMYLVTLSYMETSIEMQTIPTFRKAKRLFNKLQHEIRRQKHARL